MHLVDRIKVLVVHGDPIAHAGIAAALRQYADLDGRGSDGIGNGGPRDPRGECLVDVVVADYASGVALAKALRTLGGAASPRIVIVASDDREWAIRRALALGVRGYIVSGCGLDELADGVRAAYRGARHLSPRVAARLAESMALEALTAREEEVLGLVVAGLCNKAIGRRLNIAVGTVKSHLKASFDKLRVESRTQAAAAVERRGLLRETDRPPLSGVPFTRETSLPPSRQTVPSRRDAVAA